LWRVYCFHIQGKLEKILLLQLAGGNCWSWSVCGGKTQESWEMCLICKTDFDILIFLENIWRNSNFIKI
jgi:hypothetical protein